ncbi:MAG: hypothetical protein U5R06_11210 [candidate division KSB1 bacterium]|nr:hypothetical protein [candidate division KSB1 bacterium]
MHRIYAIEPLEALKMSIQSEKEMTEFYKKAQSLFYNDEAESTLKQMLNACLQNRQKSISQYSQVSGKRILYLNLDRKHRLNSLMHCGKDSRESINTAKRNEKELVDFYMTLSRRFLDADLRAFFRSLGDEHQDHLHKLEKRFENPELFDESAEKQNAEAA